LSKKTDNEECKKAHDEFIPERFLQGLRITCVPKPPPANKIANYGLKIEDRRFKPFPLPEIEEIYDNDDNVIGTKFRDHTQEEEHKLLKELYEYRTKGFWFYNRDRLEYLTGDHWYYLNVIKIKIIKKSNGTLKKVSGLPNWNDADRNFYYFWREVEMHHFQFGVILVSGRRSGKTSKAISILLNAATSTVDADCGLQAQNGKMAASIFSRLVRTWQNLPEHEFFFPMHVGDDNPKTTLDLRPPKKRSSKTRVNVKQKALFSKIDYRSTTSHAYDGEGLHRMFLDEASKIDGCDVNELINVIRETLAEGSRASGKMLITSTAENIGGKTLKQFEELVTNSDPSKTNDLGQTSSGFMFYFMSATKAYRHDPEDGNLPEHLTKATLDDWGYSDEEAARNVILALRKGKSGNRLIEFIRKYPLDVSEAFTYGVTDSPFDVVKLNQQKAHNHDIKRFQDPIIRGNFEWDGGVRFTKVVFHPRPDGKWLVQNLLKPESTNQSTNSMKGKTPTRFECITGIDSFDHDQTEETTESKFSKGAGVTLCHSGGYYSRPTFVCIYLNRPPKAEIFYEDMLKQSIFYSSPAMIENQKPTILSFWKKNGYGGYIMKDPLNAKSKTDGISTRSDTTRLEMDNKIMAHIYDNVGRIDESTMGNCFFDDLIKDWKEFNPQKRTKYDLSIASGLALLGTLKPVQESSIWSLDDWIPKPS
tara:strand:+ start:1940 stop:4048 length:2109 start_codon:yes stop_codon:yes gene_type:complete